MKLRELISRTEYELTAGSLETEISGLSRDDRSAKAGDLFICTKGARFDTHAPEVVKALAAKGVAAFVAERPLELPEACEAAVVMVPNTRKAGAAVYAAWYGNPAERMKIVGITGSKGKTTTAHMLYRVLKAAGLNAGIIGTNGVEYGRDASGTEGPAARERVAYELANTTPDYDQLQKILKDMADGGVEACVLEVSSQAMKLHRCGGFTFDCGVFMNIQEGDHVGPNEHETFEDYMRCKAELLNRSRVAIVNADDPYTDEVLGYVRADVPLRTFHADGVPVERFDSDGNFAGEAEAPAPSGGEGAADYRACDVRRDFDEEKGGPGVSFRTEGRVEDTFRINFPGVFNVWNALAAIAAADVLGIPRDAVKEGLADVHIKGRDDIVYHGRFSVCVDFAHNGASTRHHLEALREYRPKRLVCIFGADGNRSKGRRYGMGEAAGALADFSIVTSGHNRWETFEAILADTEVGLHKAPDPKYIAIKDREEAIRYAIDHAEDGDLITIIGLGHESWQEDHGVKRRYNDEEFVKSVLREKGLL